MGVWVRKRKYVGRSHAVGLLSLTLVVGIAAGVALGSSPAQAAGGTGSISGHVVAGDSLGYTGVGQPVTIYLYTENGHLLRQTQVVSGADYSFSSVDDGRYRVGFLTIVDGNSREYWPNAYTLADAGIVEVQGGAAVTGIDALVETWWGIDTEAILRSDAHTACYEMIAVQIEWAVNECARVTSYDNGLYVRVPPGYDYLVSAREEDLAGGHSDTRYWNSSGADRALRSNANPVDIRPDGLVMGIAFNLAGVPWIGDDTSAAIATFASSVDPLSVGVTTTLTTTTTGDSGAPSGVVELFDDKGFVGDARLTGGSVTISYTTTHPLSSPLELRYRGDSIYAKKTWHADIPFLPTIESVLPGFGSTAGGTVVTVAGNGLGSATSVTFDGVPGTNLTPSGADALEVTTPPGTSPHAEVVVTNSVGVSDPSFFAYLDPSQSVVSGSPVRILDTSSFTPGVVRCYPVVGLATVPDGATGVLLNVTTASPSGNGYVVVFPDSIGYGATPAPLSSTVNFEPGRDVANSAMVALPSDGKVCAFSAGGTLSRLVLDVAGYIVPGSGITMQSAQRLLDTRQVAQQVTGPVAPNVVNTVQVTGNAGVPAGATAVVANVTVTGVTDGGHLRVWEAGTTVPNTSVVNYAPGQTKANGQIIALSPTGALSFESFTGAGTATNPVQVIIDVVGYVEAGSQFTATDPTRIVETRASEGVVGPIPGALVPNTVYPVELTDTALIPLTATAVVLNVTAVGPTAFGNLRVYPDTNGLGTTTPPNSSVINYIPGRAIPNMVIVQIPPDRMIDFYNNMGLTSSRTDLIVDVIGYINGPTI